MNPSNQLALLIDADYYAFSAAAAVNKSVEWEDGIITQWADLEEAKQVFASQIEAIVTRNKRYSLAKPIMCFTDVVNWRTAVLPTYKGNRKGGKPLCYPMLKAWVMENYQSFERPTLEGDDCMGILSTKPSLVGCTSAIIVSPDKDFKTIPGEFLYVTTGETLHIDQASADDWHMFQTLAGDTTDGYGGCPGIGKDTARAFLDAPYMVYQETRVLKSGPNKGEERTNWATRPLTEEETLWDAIVALFVKGGQGEAEALVQARVSRILRATDFDFKTKEPILWTPPQ